MRTVYFGELRDFWLQQEIRKENSIEHTGQIKSINHSRLGGAGVGEDVGIKQSWITPRYMKQSSSRLIPDLRDSIPRVAFDFILRGIDVCSLEIEKDPPYNFTEEKWNYGSNKAAPEDWALVSDSADWDLTLS